MYKVIGGDHQQYGPVSAEELRHWLAEGRLNAQSLVQIEGSSEWRPLGTLPEFAEALRVPPGPGAPAPQPAVPPLSPEAWQAQLLTSPPRLEIGRCLELSWKLLTQNFGLFFGASALIWLIGTLSQWLPFGALFYWVLRGVFMGGLYLVFIRRIRGQPATVADAFAGFNIAFVQLLLVGLVSGVLTGIGLACCLVIPGLYLWVAWTFGIPLVADRRLEFWSAMELSRKVVTRVWFEMFGLLLLAFLPSLVMYVVVETKIMITSISTMRELMGHGGAPDFGRLFSLGVQMAKANVPLILLWKIVVLLNLPFAVGALMYAYENLFGTRAASSS